MHGEMGRRKRASAHRKFREALDEEVEKRRQQYDAAVREMVAPDTGRPRAVVTIEGERYHVPIQTLGPGQFLSFLGVDDVVFETVVPGDVDPVAFMRAFNALERPGPDPDVGRDVLDRHDAP